MAGRAVVGQFEIISRFHLETEHQPREIADA
jgi:hypothetical protein